MAINITFRTQLLGGVSEFCTSSGLPIFGNTLHLVEIVVLLAKYREEGQPLFPEVYITTDVASLCAMLPEAERLSLGTTTRDVTGIKTAIKKCAPLAQSGWLIYIEDKPEKLAFGLFRGTNNPIAVLVDTVLLDTKNTTPVTKIFQVAEDCVEIHGCNGDHHFIFLNHRREDSPPPLQSLSQLIEAIVTSASVDVREPTHSFLTRVLYNALRLSHGTLIAVTDRISPPKLFNDGIPLPTPLDFPSLIGQVRREEAAAARLVSAAALLEGMLNSDGIILFDNRGRLLGFNYFVRAKIGEKESGGARRRAFATLVKHLSKGLSGAFIQSQDGWSEFKGVLT